MSSIPENRTATVTATEVASYVYCPEHGRVEHGLGLCKSNQPQRDAGTEHHERKATAEVIACRSITLGRILVAAALVAFAAIWALGR